MSWHHLRFRKHCKRLEPRSGRSFESFGAVVPLIPDQVQELVAEGHQIIPSKWVDVDKAQYKKGQDPNYQPQYKSRLVSCGNFECSEGLRSDSPTADIEVHNS